MTTTPTLEQFLSAPFDPEEDDELTPEVKESQPSDPLVSIAASLGQLVSIAVRHDLAVEQEERDSRLYDELEAEYQLVEHQRDEAQALVAEVLRICKPSTSKLANSIRAALEAPVAPPVEEPDAGSSQIATPAQPADAADVSEWRGFARRLGYAGPDVDHMNRSQIRTMIGIPHPGAESAS